MTSAFVFAAQVPRGGRREVGVAGALQVLPKDVHHELGERGIHPTACPNLRKRTKIAGCSVCRLMRVVGRSDWG
jgi:hypothetical protein